MRLLFAVVVVSALTGQAFSADAWVDLATVSTTAPHVAGRICYTDGRDIACDANAPLLSSLGGLQGDRITSGTSAVIVSGSGVVNVVTNGVTASYFNSSGLLVTPGISVTSAHGISSTGGYFSGNVGIGISPQVTYPLYISGTSYSRIGFIGAASNTGYVGYAGSNRFFVGTNNPFPLSIITSGTVQLSVNEQGRVGIGTLTPNAKLDVVGMVSASDLYVRGTIDIVTTTNNVIVGNGAGLGMSTGSTNFTGLGHMAGYQVSGTYVTAIGKSAGFQNTGNFVTAVGMNAASTNSGSYVTAVGLSSAYLNSGTNVTTLGAESAYLNSGTNVTAAGVQAGYQNTGSNAAAFGMRAGFGNTYNNVTLLGYNARASKSNQVVLGDGNVVEVATSGTIMAAGLNATTVSTTYLYVNGVAVTGGGAGGATDMIVSGTAFVKALQNTGAEVSGTLMVSTTLACSSAMYGAVRTNPVTGRFEQCLLR